MFSVLTLNYKINELINYQLRINKFNVFAIDCVSMPLSIYRSAVSVIGGTVCLPQWRTTLLPLVLSLARSQTIQYIIIFSVIQVL